MSDTNPTHRITYLPKINKENLLEPTKLTLDENNQSKFSSINEVLVNAIN